MKICVCACVRAYALRTRRSHSANSHYELAQSHGEEEVWIPEHKRCEVLFLFTRLRRPTRGVCTVRKRAESAVAAKIFEFPSWMSVHVGWEMQFPQVNPFSPTVTNTLPFSVNGNEQNSCSVSRLVLESSMQARSDLPGWLKARKCELWWALCCVGYILDGRPDWKHTWTEAGRSGVCSERADTQNEVLGLQ